MDSKNTKALESFLKPWYQSLEDPEQAQQTVLEKLLNWYRNTHYGAERRVETVATMKEYFQAFPVVTYQELLPQIENMKKGEYKLLLPQPPLAWAMTRGTTGESKFIPWTEVDLNERVLCGPRCLLNYVIRHQKYEILQGACLNLNFPSVLGTFRTEDGAEIPYGYSSGLYAKFNAERAALRLIPSQEEVDALGGSITNKDWERRFELAYTKAKAENVTMLIGVTQVMIQFARFLKKRFKKYPRDIWNIKLLICSSTPGIHTRYRPALKGLYGKAAITEIYGATEGLYAQQLDENPYIVPNFDVYLFEVETRGKTKLLHQLKKGEYGSLIISSVLFPRYRIGDIIKCFGNYYYRVLGREKPLVHLRYLIGRLLGYS